jgi:hypothetical protein
MIASIAATVALLLLADTSLPRLLVPDFPDLTIKTRTTSDGMETSRETLYLKGSRQRREYDHRGPHATRFVSIRHCDVRKAINLNPEARTYVSSPIQDPSERLSKSRKTAHPIPATGPEVTITVDSVDTGERRQFGRLTARRVRVTKRVEPSSGAVMPASTEEVDGWYLDLPGVYCQESPARNAILFAQSYPAGSPRARLQVKRLGAAPTGFPIEQTTRHTEAGTTYLTRVELLEFSESAIDPSLFEIPPGYNQALELPGGGYDMTKPSTVGNRMQQYWTYLARSVRRWLH